MLNVGKIIIEETYKEMERIRRIYPLETNNVLRNNHEFVVYDLIDSKPHKRVFEGQELVDKYFFLLDLLEKVEPEIIEEENKMKMDLQFFGRNKEEEMKMKNEREIENLLSDYFREKAKLVNEKEGKEMEYEHEVNHEEWMLDNFEYIDETIYIN